MRMTIEILEHCICPDCLTDVTVNPLWSSNHLVLLTFPRPNIVFGSHSRRTNLWSQEMSKYFPNVGPRILATRPDTDFGHGGSVWCLAYSPDSKWLATGSDDCTIILWDSDGKLVQE
ncbi:hypothetical protein BD309DRAFT_1024699 [Dichomitus squalens]|uniref:Uncharacterized protein n=1 Tax=Dichomitus squalens TaxID=114155 RepID=A0A4Q9PDF4_9APHY|nr:hypothetical protein BD309DRAFT_1024699 [Dichomitus squalens]TBU51062.1 hypothetical protein BD310DRAFT_982980 [Dichomitus squalens]